MTSTITIRHYKSNKSNKNIMNHSQITTPSFRQSFKSTMNIPHVTSIINHDNDESNLSSCSILYDLCSLSKESKHKPYVILNDQSNKSKNDYKDLDLTKKGREVKSSTDLIKVKSACGSITTNDNSNSNSNLDKKSTSNSLSFQKKDSLIYIQNNWAMGILETITTTTTTTNKDNAYDYEYEKQKERKEKEGKDKSLWRRLFNIDNFRCGI